MGGRAPDHSEPSLQEILSDPIVRLIMEADGVDEPALRALFERTASNVCKLAAAQPRLLDEPPAPMPADERYRLGVGIMLLNREGLIFVGQRIDRSEEAWQMPQGGIDTQESPTHAALRELQEELGTKLVEIVTSTGSWLQYELPDDVVRGATHGRWRGQLQKWFLMRFTGRDTDIDIATEHPEFSDWKWVSPAELVRLIVPFKRPLYLAVLQEFDAQMPR